MFKTLFIILIVVVLISAGFYYIKTREEMPVILEDSILTYDECMQSKERKIVESYPDKCVTKDGVVYIEQITDPVDTGNWVVFDTGLGYSFKCPPYWQCTKHNNFATVESNYYLTSAFINFTISNPENYQLSVLRHPNYKNPVVWLNEVKQKKADAIKVYPQTIKSTSGSSEQFPPAYHGVSYERIRELRGQEDVGIVMPREGNDVYGVIPVSSSSAALVTPLNDDIVENPIVKGIISTITSNK